MNRLTFALNVNVLNDVTGVSLIDLALYSEVITLFDFTGNWQLLYKSWR